MPWMLILKWGQKRSDLISFILFGQIMKVAIIGFLSFAFYGTMPNCDITLLTDLLQASYLPIIWKTSLRPSIFFVECAIFNATWQSERRYCFTFLISAHFHDDKKHCKGFFFTHCKMLGSAVKILCLVTVSSFLISDGEAKGVNWGPLLEALLENEIRPQSTAGVSEFYSILVQSSFKIFSKPFLIFRQCSDFDWKYARFDEAIGCHLQRWAKHECRQLQW